jgi:hypothetical protein|tara:strand:- start:345 stop:590 length:246 start_codon:yes stop_codon:yes gene_type:complete
MCFNNNKPTPQINKPATPPPQKELQIAKTSKLDPRRVEPEKKKPVSYGAKSLRDTNKVAKRDAASLLIPLNSGDSKGGINA